MMLWGQGVVLNLCKLKLGNRHLQHRLLSSLTASWNIKIYHFVVYTHLLMATGLNLLFYALDTVNWSNKSKRHLDKTQKVTMKKSDHICQYTDSKRFEINIWNMRFCQNNKTWKYDICALKRCKSECMQQKSKFFPTFRWRWFPYLQWRQCPPC